MAVIPYQPADLDEPGELVTAIRNRRGGQLLNLDRMLLHSPALAAGWNSFLGQVRNELSLPPRLRELAICAVAVLNGARYEALHHEPEYLQVGGTQRQLDALQSFGHAGWDSGDFDDSEQAVLELTRVMTREIEVPRSVLESIIRTLGNHQQCVELIGVIAAYNMVSRFLVALGIDPEENPAAKEMTADPAD